MATTCTSVCVELFCLTWKASFGLRCDDGLWWWWWWWLLWRFAAGAQRKSANARKVLRRGRGAFERFALGVAEASVAARQMALRADCQLALSEMALSSGQKSLGPLGASCAPLAACHPTKCDASTRWTLFTVGFWATGGSE